MKKSNWKTYAFWILLTEAVGGLSGFLSREGIRIYSETITQPRMEGIFNFAINLPAIKAANHTQSHLKKA